MMGRRTPRFTMTDGALPAGLWLIGIGPGDLGLMTADAIEHARACEYRFLEGYTATLPEEQEPLTLTINAKGEIFIQESKVDYEKIIAKILAVSKNRTDTRIYVRGDKAINYGRVLEIMGMLSGSGFTKVALISEPYKER